MGPLAGHCEQLLVRKNRSNFRGALQRTDHEFVRRYGVIWSGFGIEVVLSLGRPRSLVQPLFWKRRSLVPITVQAHALAIPAQFNQERFGPWSGEDNQWGPLPTTGRLLTCQALTRGNHHYRIFVQTIVQHLGPTELTEIAVLCIALSHRFETLADHLLNAVLIDARSFPSEGE